MAHKKEAVIIVFLMTAAMLAVALPPAPHGVSGFILFPGGTQVPLGTPYLMNNTNNAFFSYRNETSSPVPGYSGWYSVTVNGSDGDAMRFVAWNITAYGEHNFTLSGDMEINLTLNKTRPPEINLSITEPNDDANFNLSDSFLVNVSINVLGDSDATGCNFTISLNSSVLVLSQGESYVHNRSTIAKGSVVYEVWNVSSTLPGHSNITVNSSCDSDSKNLNGLTADTVTNITIVDTSPPVVKIASPGNNTQYMSSNTVVFQYNVTDASEIVNCTLFVNSTYQNHTNSPPKNTLLNLSASLGNSLYNWTINCTDSEGNVGTAGHYNVSVAVFTPFVSLINIENPVSLHAGTNKELRCNGTAADNNGYENIGLVNATFYFTDGGYSAGSPNSNSSHYSVTCTTGNGFGSTLDFECVFNLTYYTPSGEWQCNVSVTDTENHSNSSTMNTNVSELYAISLPSVLNYGVVLPNQISSEEPVNVENVGNVNINISVRGYGRTDGDNLSMVCTRGNISVTDERYNTTQGLSFSSMYNLSSKFAQIPGFLINRSNGTQSQRSLYWRVHPGFGLSGDCNGTLIFSVVVQ